MKLSDNNLMTPQLKVAMTVAPPKFPQNQLDAAVMVVVRDYAGYRLTEASRNRFHAAGIPCDTWADIIAIQKDLPKLLDKKIINEADALVINTILKEFDHLKPDNEAICKAFKDKEVAIIRLCEMLHVHRGHLAEETGENTAKAIVNAIVNAAGRALKQLRLKKSITLQVLRSLDDVYSWLLLSCQMAGMWDGDKTEAQRKEFVDKNGDPFGFPDNDELRELSGYLMLVSLQSNALDTTLDDYSKTLYDVVSILNGRKADMVLSGQSWPKVESPPDSYADELTKLAKINSVIPKCYISSNDTLSNHLTSQTAKKLEINKTDTENTEEPKKTEKIKDGKIRQKNATKAVIISASLETEFELSEPITEFDRAVANGVYSHLEEGNTVFTSAMIYRTITGKTDREYVTAAQIKLIDESITKQAVIRVWANLSDAAHARKVIDPQTGKPIEDDQPLKIDSFLLPVEPMTVDVKGEPTPAYRIVKTPPLYQWAKMTRQITTLPIDVMDVKKIRGGKIGCQSESTSETRTAIKSYLLRRLQAIHAYSEQSEDIQRKARRRKKTDKEETEHTETIRYDSVMQAAGVEWGKLSRDSKNNYRKFIKTCLMNWTEDTSIAFSGFEYSDEKRKNEFIGLRINYPKKQKR